MIKKENLEDDVGETTSASSATKLKFAAKIKLHHENLIIDSSVLWDLKKKTVLVKLYIYKKIY